MQSRLVPQSLDAMKVLLDHLINEQGSVDACDQ